MTRRVERYNMLAERRAAKIPIQTLTHVKSLALRLELTEELRQKKDGPVTAVISSIDLVVGMTGRKDPIAVHLAIPVKQGATFEQELEDYIRKAIADGFSLIIRTRQAELPKPEAKASAGKGGD